MKREQAAGKKIRRNGDAVFLTLSGELTVGRAAQLKADLLDALGRGNRLVLDLGGVTEADVTCLQLLCATHRSAAAQGKRVEFAAHARESWEIEEVVDAAGFRRGKGGEDFLWKEERDG